MEQLFSCSIFTVIIEALSHDLSLRDLIELGDAIGQDSVSSGWELGMSCVVDVVEVIHYEFDLIFVGDGSSEGLELELLHLLRFTVTDRFDHGIEVFLVLRRDVDWLLIGVLVTWTSSWITDSKVSR